MLTALDLSQCVILDTETTGDDWDDEIIEMAIIRADNGEVLFDEQFNPAGLIKDEAFAVHGISENELEGKPRFYHRFDEIMQIVNGKTVIGWKIQFDIRLLLQTMKLLRIPKPKENAKLHDLKPDYLSYLQVIEGKPFPFHYVYDEDEEDDVIDENSVHLVSACKYENIDISGLTPHRALSDCQMVYRLLHHNMASRGCKNAIVT